MPRGLTKACGQLRRISGGDQLFEMLLVSGYRVTHFIHVGVAIIDTCYPTEAAGDVIKQLLGDVYRRAK